MSVCHQLVCQQSLEWYKIRDTLLGCNYVKQDVKKAIDLAAVCKHPDAVWLTKVFLGRHVNDWKVARNILLEFKSDPRALCMSVSHFHPDVEIWRAADLGDAYAQSIVAIRSGHGEERFRWAQKSVAQGERDGFYALGICYQNGDSCEAFKEDREKAKYNYQIAADLGHVLAMNHLGYFFDSTQRYVWFGKAAACGGYHDHFLYEMRLEIGKFNSGFRHVNIIFAIGRILKGHIDNKNQSLFGTKCVSDTMNAANQAFQIYSFQLQSYRKAVDTWTIIGKRYSVVKDIRKMIGEIIWKSRDDAKYA